jgi:hypothetical protein
MEIANTWEEEPGLATRATVIHVEGYFDRWFEQQSTYLSIDWAIPVSGWYRRHFWTTNHPIRRNLPSSF